jgi:YteA family regulatory protein
MQRLRQSQIEALGDKLLKEKREIGKHFEMNDTVEKTALTDSTGELSSYDNHPADMATETFERERDNAIDDAFSQRLEEIDQALARIENGTYGVCVVCGEPIPYERLEAIPSAPTCLEDAPKPGDPAGRPVEEQVMTPPPSGAGESRQRNAGRFDDADAWKDVESYGSSDSPAT